MNGKEDLVKAPEAEEARLRNLEKEISEYEEIMKFYEEQVEEYRKEMLSKVCEDKSGEVVSADILSSTSTAN